MRSVLLLVVLVVAVLISAPAAALSRSSSSTILPLLDTPYEQVISDRYLFSTEATECTSWPTLPIAGASVVVAPPPYHPLASEGTWMVASEQAGSTGLYWFNITTGTLTSAIESGATFGGVGVECPVVVAPESEEYATEYTLIALCVSGSPTQPQTQIIQLLCESSFLCTPQTQPNSVYTIPGSPLAAYVITELGAAGQVAVGTSSGLSYFDLTSLAFTMNVNNITDPVTSIAYSVAHQTLFAGTATNMYIQDLVLNTWRAEEVNGLIDGPITSLAYDSVNDQLWIGQLEGVTLYAPVIMPDQQTHWVFTRLAGMVTDPGSDVGGLPFAGITTLAFPSMLVSSTTNTTGDSRMWLGGVRGLMRYDAHEEVKEDQWRVYNSARYMPQRDAQVNVSSLTLLAPLSSSVGNIAVAITLKGVAVIRYESWTLQQKAAALQAIQDTGRHTRYGLVSQCESTVWGSTETCKKTWDDNDGLWTAIYLSSQLWRYAITNDTSVYEQALVHYEAMRFQQTITGIYGYPARSVALITDNPPGPTDPHWFPSPINSTWRFKGDTSSDEITGHQFIHPLVQDILGVEGAAWTAVNITNNIVAHNYTLVGETGHGTRWGNWNPATINLNPLWQEGRGPNSIQIQAWLVQAQVLDPENAAVYNNALAYLLSPANRYDVNLLNPKMIAVCDSDFSDDELNYIAWFNMRHGLNGMGVNPSKEKKGEKIQQKKQQQKKKLAQKNLNAKKNGKRHSNNIHLMSTDENVATSSSSFASTTSSPISYPTLSSYMSLGLDMSHRYKVVEKSPWFNTIYCFVSGQVGAPEGMERKYVDKKKQRNGKGYPAPPNVDSPEFDCATLSIDSVWYLRRWPLEQFDWPQFNSDRLDIVLNNPAYGCRAGAQSVQLLPPDESATHKWNFGPFALDGGEGMSEEGVGPFLSSYWMMRYYGVLSAPEAQQ